MTLIELLAVLVIVAMLTALVFPIFVGPGRSPTVNCMSNLKQADLAFELWRADNNNLFPMQFFTNGDGSMKFANAANGYRYFQSISNYLGNPTLLVCPMDKKRARTTDWAANFSGANISYFLDLDATILVLDSSNLSANTILLGDRNLTNGQDPRDGILNVTSKQAIGWTPERHQGRGVIAFTDGHVIACSMTGLPRVLAQTGLATNRLLMP